MKYLKKYNEELFAATYKSAADKLKKFGHNRRASLLMNKYKDILPNEIKIKWGKLVDEYSKYGKIKVEFTHKDLDPYLIECYYFINFYKNDVVIPEITESYKMINIPLEMSIIPTNMDDYFLIQELFNYDNPQEYYNLFKINININVKEDNWDISKVFFMEQPGVEKPNNFTYGIYDRGSAGKVSRVIKKIFNRDYDYPSGNTYDYKETLYDEINRIVFIESGVSSNCGMSIENIEEYLLKNLNANILFQN